ncbi:MAG TPA: HDIG domain-containing protein [Spirochaetota bacterium]|nr:HDIG domain-containing protein [Spirochaetota bacterium]HPJ36211.1 HDIG domain-containing protein [Spirochaetota bacterium]
MSAQREESLNLLNEYVKNDRMIAHSIASEAVMKALAEKLGEDQCKWGTAGLLHDIDVEITNADMKTHGLKAVEILEAKGYDPEIIDAIKMHNEEATGLPRTTKFQHALAAGETITGLIFATALVYPDKKLTSVKPKSITKRMKEKAFAASVKRENILECEEIGIPLADFAALSLAAMQEISEELGF